MRTDRSSLLASTVAPVALALLALACAGAEDPPAEDGPPPAARDTGAAADAPADTATAPLIARIYDYGLGFGESVATIRARLGQPVDADTSLQPNRHVPEATDSLFTLEYPGLTFELNRPGPVEGDLLTSVAISSPERELPGGFRVGGTTRAGLIDRLGEPGETRARGDTTVLAYELPGVAAARWVDFHVAGDTLRRVTWAPYVD